LLLSRIDDVQAQANHEKRKNELGSIRKLRIPPCMVPNTEDLDPFLVFLNAIEDPVFPRYDKTMSPR
jgi:hypothetical protein